MDRMERAIMCDDILRRFKRNKAVYWQDLREEFKDNMERYHLIENQINYLIADNMIKRNFTMNLDGRESLTLTERGFVTFADIENLGYVGILGSPICYIVAFNNGSGYGINQTYGGNINFENQDGSTNLYINTFNKSTYANLLKLGSSPTPSTGDSLLVWEAADSSVRKIAQSALSGGSGSGGSYNGVGTGSPSAAIGSGATVTIDGTNQGGMITLTTGTGLIASATLVTLTYSTAYPNNSYSVTSAANQLTANMETTDQATFLSGNKNGFSIVANTNALSPSTTYVWYYTVTGR